MTKIKAMRIKSGMTQKQLAEAIGVTPAVMANIENGRRRVDVKLLKKLAAALKCTVYKLIEYDPYN